MLNIPRISLLNLEHANKGSTLLQEISATKPTILYTNFKKFKELYLRI